MPTVDAQFAFNKTKLLKVITKEIQSNGGYWGGREVCRYVGGLGSSSSIVPLLCLELNSVFDILKLVMATVTTRAFFPLYYSIHCIALHEFFSILILCIHYL